MRVLRKWLSVVYKNRIHNYSCISYRTQLYFAQSKNKKNKTKQTEFKTECLSESVKNLHIIFTLHQFNRVAQCKHTGKILLYKKEGKNQKRQRVKFVVRIRNALYLY